MLDERKTSILRAVIQEYVATAQPVGSSHVARSPGVNVSSATVRNEMAVLEQEGYLVQPHTSAGRVPTDKGYRYFVDHLSRPGRLDEDGARQVHEFFAAAHGALEQMLQRTSGLLARLTNYAAVVIAPGHEVASVRSVHITSLSSRLLLVVAVLTNGQVEHEPVDATADLPDEARVNAAAAHLTHHLAGSTLAALADVPDTGDAGIDDVVKLALAALGRIAAQDDGHVFVGGASRMAAAFDAVEVVRDVLLTLEQQYVVTSLLRSVLDSGLSVAIGTEHGIEPLAACSVVVRPYVVEGEPIGTIGVVGPTRMDYPHALAVVDVVSEQLGERLSDGHEG